MLECAAPNRQHREPVNPSATPSYRPPTPPPPNRTPPRHTPLLLTVPGDDRAFEHHVCFPRCDEEGYDPEGLRYSFVFCWCRGVREYDPATHRNKSGNAVTNPEEFAL